MPTSNAPGATVVTESDKASPPISPTEILMTILQKDLDPRIISLSNVIVGPATNAQQQAGCASVTDAGNGQPPPQNAPLIYPRCQIRVLHHDLSFADRIAYHIYQTLNGRRREVVTLKSTDQQWFVHYIAVSAGPSAHFDSQVTWEYLMFVTMMVGTVPVSSDL